MGEWVPDCVSALPPIRKARGACGHIGYCDGVGTESTFSWVRDGFSMEIHADMGFSENEVPEILGI